MSARGEHGGEWIAAAGDATYHVFNRSAQPVATHTLPGDRRVVAFGSGAAYVVAMDEFDLNYLERYALPGN